MSNEINVKKLGIYEQGHALSYEDMANMFVNQINEAELSGSDSSDSFDQPED